MFSTRVIAFALVAITFAPVPSRADVLLVPFFGVNFGGDSGKEFSEAFDSSQYNWGASVTFMGAGIFGIEGDIGFSPDFYGKTDAGGSNALTATGSLILGIPFGGQQGFGVRPYGVIGAGLLKSTSDFGDAFTNIDESNVTWSAGGGVLLFSGPAPDCDSTCGTSAPSMIWRSSASRLPSHPGRSTSRGGRWAWC